MSDIISELQHHKPNNILIIEDERETADLYNRYLNDEYKTEIATSGKQALSKLSVDTDLLLLDLNLPQMGGQEILKRINNDKVENSNPKVIVITTRKPPGEVIRKDIDKYKIKPVYQDELLNVIEEIALQNKFHHISRILFQKQSKLNALSEAGKTDTEYHRELTKSVKNLENKLSEVYKEINNSTAGGSHSNDRCH
jgi:DNA-binding response OmpR family regulator